jgi:hypothetical protein
MGRPSFNALLSYHAWWAGRSIVRYAGERALHLSDKSAGSAIELTLRASICAKAVVGNQLHIRRLFDQPRQDGDAFILQAKMAFDFT